MVGLVAEGHVTHTHGLLPCAREPSKRATRSEKGMMISKQKGMNAHHMNAPQDFCGFGAARSCFLRVHKIINAHRISAGAFMFLRVHKIINAQPFYRTFLGYRFTANIRVSG